MSWTVDDARDLYGVKRWGNEYFDINADGDAVVLLEEDGAVHEVSLQKIVEGLRERGSEMPVILRFKSLLDGQIRRLNEAFNQAIEEANYAGNYRGVYPIKVNQQQQIIEEITSFGEQYHYGLEAGSKPELIAALAYMHDKEAYLVCNGYKDDEFVDLALMANQMGMRVILVLEMPGELPAIIARSKALGIRPELGIRFRLSTKSEGHWAESGGDRSVFGLNSPQLIDAVEILKEADMLDCLKLFHYHQGSQLPNIRSIRESATEAVRVFVSLAQEGAPMEILDMGGGLAIDYDGSHTNASSSCNYSLSEYTTNLIEVVKMHCDEAGVSHPTLVTESGRAVSAYYSVLVFNILDTTRFACPEEPEAPSADAHDMVQNLWQTRLNINERDLQGCFNDAMFYRDQVRELFRHGLVTLRERASAETIYWHICTRIAAHADQMDEVPEDVQSLQANLIDFYYANFSVFQSLPDAWAIDQLFPIMPIHKLGQKPTNRAILADITCDCDGKIDRFIDGEGTSPYLNVHDRQPGEEYNIGVFLVGAYQETLGDLHNLLGDPHVASIGIKNGKVTYNHELEGDTVADVLSYVEYDPKDLEKRFRHFAEEAVTEGLISAKQRKEILNAYRVGLSGYTYYEG
ncbi:biosynthetic arginine decarboxylase [Rubritalea marina]|uniref:biosynthetic arginine decarboxylase n=1 Tax=Rubritalea marina TaxID=361055 RepID=UPI00037F1980|nr:biosynthetic arginine decarboxylase [Rubritalea marina]